MSESTTDLHTDDRVLERFDVAVRMPDGVTYQVNAAGSIEYLGQTYRIAAAAHERTTAFNALPRPHDGMAGLVKAFREQVQRMALPPQDDPVRVLRKVTEVRDPWFEHEAVKA